jgi:hypothetical protein
LPTFLKTLPAKDGPALCRLKGHGRFLSALRASGPGFYLGVTPAVAGRGCGAKDGDAFGFAGLATFGFVLELFVMKKQLFAGRENKVGATVDTLEYLVLEFH